MKKFVDKVKLFQRSVHPKRYFLIDFTSANLYIRKDPWKDKTIKIGQDAETKTIPFRSVTDVYLPKGEIHQTALPKKWKWPFYVQTDDRTYVLCAPSD